MPASGPRERHQIGIDEIVRAAEAVNDRDRAAVSSAAVSSAIAEAERAFSEALSRISVDELARDAEASAHSVQTSVQKPARDEPRP